jgi:hypothetical protein
MKITAIKSFVCNARVRKWVESAIAKYPFKQELLQRVFYADGSVGDW